MNQSRRHGVRLNRRVAVTNPARDLIGTLSTPCGQSRRPRSSAAALCGVAGRVARSRPESSGDRACAPARVCVEIGWASLGPAGHGRHQRPSNSLCLMIIICRVIKIIRRGGRPGAQQRARAGASGSQGAGSSALPSLARPLSDRELAEAWLRGDREAATKARIISRILVKRGCTK
jgi:hypothetical protein